MPNLPGTLIEFIHTCVPTYQAAELILFFAANPDRRLRAEEIVVAMRPTIITVPAVKEYAALLTARGVITEQDAGYQYGPSPLMEGRIGELAHAYNEKPVTLIRAIYQIADSKIQSLADAFKLRRDES